MTPWPMAQPSGNGGYDEEERVSGVRMALRSRRTKCDCMPEGPDGCVVSGGRECAGDCSSEAVQVAVYYDIYMCIYGCVYVSCQKRRNPRKKLKNYLKRLEKCSQYFV